MNSDKINFLDLLKTVYRYKKSMFLIVILTFAFSIQLTFWIAKDYRSSFSINIYPTYFQSPLISEIKPGGYSESEMKTTIDAMVKESLNDRFIDSIGRKFKIYKKKGNPFERSRERQLLRERISFFPGSGQSYQVQVFNEDPFMAKKIAEFSLSRIREYFIEKRLDTIELVKVLLNGQINAVQKELNQKNKTKSTIEDQVSFSKSPEILKAELKKIKSHLQVLKGELSLHHPKILDLQEQKKSLESWLASADLKDAGQSSMVMSNGFVVTGPNQMDSLMDRYQKLSMALDIERNSLEKYIAVVEEPQLPTTPISPKKRIFATVGLILGMVFAFLYVFTQELVLPNRNEQLELASKKLGTIVLGYLPHIREEKIKINEVIHDPCFN